MTTFDALSTHLTALAPAGAWLARTSIDAAVIAALVLVTQTAIGRWLTPAWRYRLWALVVLRLVLPVLPASPTSLWSLHFAAPVRQLFTPAAEIQNVRHAPEAPPPPAVRPGVTVKVFVGPLDPALAVPPAVSPPTPQHATPPLATPPASPSRLPLLIAITWLTGVVFLVTRLLVANIAFARRLRRARPVSDPIFLALLADCARLMRVTRLPPVLVTDVVRGPAAAGVWRRRILQPTGLFDVLSPAEQRTVLLHELAHVRCADVAANWLLAVLQAIHWFNPVLWLAFARLRSDRELARDAMVLSVATAADEDTDARATAAQRYAQTLLRLTERLSARPTAGLPATTVAAVAGVAGIVGDPRSSFTLVPGLFAGRTALQRRLRMITRLPAATTRRRFRFVGPALLLALGCATLTRPTSGEPAPAAAPEKPVTRPAFAEAEERRAGDLELRAKLQPLLGQARYREALLLAEEALRADPRNKYASDIRPLLQDRVAGAPQRTDALPPPPLADLKAFQAKLDHKLPEVKFDQVAFNDVIEFLRDVSGTNIFVNWKGLEAAGIDRKALVTVRMFNVKFSKALQVILDSVSTPKVRLGFKMDEDVITVSTIEELQRGNTLTRVYDIRDLLISTPDFEPAEGLLGLSPTTKPADAPPEQKNPSGRGEPRKTREDLVKEIVKLITDTVETATWKDNGGAIGSIREMSGQLVVTQTPENQEYLAKLLEQLRETKGIQVSVEARFVTCDEEVVAGLLKEWGKAAPGGTNPATLPSLPAVRGAPERGPVGIYLNEDQVNELMRAARTDKDSAVVSAPRMTLFSGQRAYVLVSSEQAYVQDYAAIAKNGEVRYEPVMGVAQDGVLTDMRATVSADRRFATLMVHPKLTTLLGMNRIPWQGRPAGSNLTVQVPDMKTTELRTTVSVPDGTTVLLGGLEYPGDRPDGAAAAAAGPTTSPATRPAAKPGRNMLLLVKPKLILQREVEQKTSTPGTTRPATNPGQ